MPDIFISYCREDVSIAKILAEKLTGIGWDVWWDHRIVAGSYFRKTIEENLDAATAVIVIWSVSSIDSDFVIDEAKEALNHGKLVPIQVGEIDPPMGFRSIHYIKWNGNDSMEQDEFDELVSHLKLKMGAHSAAVLQPADDLPAKAIEVKKTKSLNYSDNDPVHQVDKVKLASIWFRFLAAIIEFIVFFLIYMVIATIDGQLATDEVSTDKKLVQMTFNISVVIFFLYLIISEGLTGKTLGKRMLNIKVVKEDYTKGAFWQSLLRHLLDFIDVIFFIGLIIAANNKKRQRLGDLISKTVVISTS